MTRTNWQDAKLSVTGAVREGERRLLRSVARTAPTVLVNSMNIVRTANTSWLYIFWVPDVSVIVSRVNHIDMAAILESA